MSTHAGSDARAERLAAQMQRALAALIRREVKDPRVGNVTVTAVDLAPDLTFARVYVVPFATTARPSSDAGGSVSAPGAGESSEALVGLRSAAGFLRGQLARELALRRAPRLQFELDSQPERAQRLTLLIDDAVRDDRARGPRS